jgi:hypothetical protein
VVAAGCQSSQLSVSPPSFDAPVIRPDKPTPPPIANARPSSPNSAITSIGGDPLITGLAISPKVKSRRWKYIIIHHSDTPMGSARRFDAAHRARGWEMLGYDFVIGNGSETRDGLIEAGPRWTYQLDGAHTGTPDHKYNEWGIGICLVGNFENTQPTKAQMESLARLCAYFMKTYGIPASNIVGHRDCKPTGCPGRFMYADLPRLRQMASAYAATRSSRP